MLSNTTNQNLSVLVNVLCHGAIIPAKPVSLSSHQMVVIEIEKLLKDLEIPAERIEQGGLQLLHNGPPGALIAHGVTLNTTRHLASNLKCVDPAAQSSSVLEATGLLISQAGAPFSPSAFFTPTLALNNASASPQRATVTVQYTVKGILQSKSLAAIEIGPYETHVADFSSLLSSLQETVVSAAGLKVEFSGKPGSLVATLSSIDQSGSEVVDVPLFDVDAKVYKAGNHPFRLDANTQTIAFVKNAGLRPTTVIVIIRYAGGEYTPELLKLKACETLAIDLRQLRDSRAKDVRGRRLPENLTEGQFIWYPHRTEPLVGRAVLIDTSAGTASNFSCSNCCSPNFDHLEHFPASFNGVPGDSQQITISEFDRDSCSQLLFGPYDVTNQCEYSSDNTPVATVSATGMVNAAAAGAATLTMTYPFAQTTQFNGFDCTTTTSAVSDSTPVQVCSFTIQGTALATCDEATKNKSSFTGNPSDPNKCLVNANRSNLTFSVSGPATAIMPILRRISQLTHYSSLFILQGNRIRCLDRL